jgi:hypothetical protein
MKKDKKFTAQSQLIINSIHNDFMEYVHHRPKIVYSESMNKIPTTRKEFYLWHDNAVAVNYNSHHYGQSAIKEVSQLPVET